MIGGRVARLALPHARCRIAVGGLRCVSSATPERPLLQYVSLERLAHQSRLELQIADSTRATIRVAPTLHQADFALRVFASGKSADLGSIDILAVEEESAEGDASVVKRVRVSKNASPTYGIDGIDVLLHVPHLLDLGINVVRGSVLLDDKLEGDVNVVVGTGDITVNKVRGEQVQLKTNRGYVNVSSLVEGEKVKIAASAVKVKRLMSSSTEIKIGKGTENSELGAVYSSLCLLNTLSSGSLTVGNIHGFLRIHGEELQAVNVHSVNGALHVEDSGLKCSVDAHFDAWSPEAANKIFVGGNVHVSLDPSAPIDVELHGNQIATENCKFGEQELDQLDEDYAIFTGSLLASAASSASIGASGKINVGSAKTSALRTSFFAAENDTSDHGSPFASSDIHPASLPRLVVHASNGSVSIEQLDWMGKVKRKHLAK